MFRKALVKMTLIYLSILMTISLFFSFALYRISTQEIQGSLSRQQKVFEGVGPFMHEFLDEPSILAQRDEEVITATRRIIWNLLYTNIVILIIGGGLSYYLALITIEPIEKAHEAQVRFTGDASHELRSPLASMKSEIEVALRDPKLEKEEAVSILQSNLEEVERLSLLSGYLLELAKEEDGKLKLEKVKLLSIAKKSVDSILAKVEKKKIAIKIKVDKEIQASVNQESLRDLLVILLDNAIKFSEDGKKITIDAKRNGRYVDLSITDQGTGIKETDIPHIFERFYRADGSRCKTSSEGYGLGLPLAKKIAEANRATITVQSKECVGSTFTVRLLS